MRNITSLFAAVESSINVIFFPPVQCVPFTGVRKIQIGGLWKLSSIIKADQKVLKKAGLLPDMDAKYLALGAEAANGEGLTAVSIT